MDCHPSVYILGTWFHCGDVRLNGFFKTRGLFGVPCVTDIPTHLFLQDS